jgi:hypothetical protein
MTATIPFMGFNPNVDPTVPGTIMDCKNMVPTMRGMKSAPSQVHFGNPAFPSQVAGAATCELLNGAYRTLVATASHIYEVIGTANNDVSGSGPFTGGVTPVYFVQFGNATILCDGTDPLKQSISSGVFNSIAGAPAAAIIEVVQGFVFALNTVDPTYGTNPHGWWCSGLYDQTVWTPAQATQCARGVIVDTPGKLTAGKALGTNIVIFKGGSMFYGTYQGPPVIWAMNLISPIIGTPCQDCVVSVGTNLFFLGSDFQVYAFDGTRPAPIGDEVHSWLRDNWSALYQSSVKSFYDEPNSLVTWYICSKSNSTGIPDLGLVFNHRTGKFGRADLNVEVTVQAISGQITWDGMGAIPNVTTWDTLPKIAYNSSFWEQSLGVPAMIDTNHLLQTLNGATGPSSITTGFFGDDSDYSYIQGILPRFLHQPATCSGSATLLKSMGSNTPTVVNLPEMYDGEIACDFSSRWTSITLNMTGNHEILGALPRLESAGAI